MSLKNIEITTPFIKLDSLLKLADAVSSGGEAKTLIREGEVTVEGQVCTQRGKKIRPGDTVVYEKNEYGVQYEDQ